MKTLLRLLAFAAATVAAFGVQTTVLFDTDTGRLKRPFVILPADGGVPSGGQTGYVLTKVSGSDYDYTWSAAGAGAGTVTSVGLSMPAIFQVADSPVTTSGTIAVTLATQSANLVFAGPSTGSAAAPTFRSLVAADLPTITSLGTVTTGVWNGTAIAADYGGTGQTSYTVGDLLYASSSSALSKLAAVATGQVLISTGTGTAPAWSNNPAISGGVRTSSVTSLTTESLTLATLDSNANLILDPHGTGIVKTDAQVVITNNATQLTAGASGTLLHLASTDSTVTRVTLDSFGTATNISFRRASGTNASRSALAVNDVIATLAGMGWDGSAYSAGNRGGISIVAAGTWSGTSHPTYLQLQTTQVGATTVATVATVTSAGNFLIGTASESGLTGSGGLSVSSTTDATMSTAASLITAGGLGVAKKGIFGDALSVVYSSITLSLSNNGTNAVVGTTSNHALGLYTNNTIYGTLSTAGALRLHAYTTAGMLVNDTSGNITSAAINPTYTTSSPTTTYTWTASGTAPVQNLSLTFGGNVTISMSGWTNGMTGVLIVKQDATGSRTITLPANSKALSGGAGALTLTTTANAIDILTVIYDGTNYFWSKVLNFT